MENKRHIVLGYSPITQLQLQKGMDNLRNRVENGFSVNSTNMETYSNYITIIDNIQIHFTKDLNGNWYCTNQIKPE